MITFKTNKYNIDYLMINPHYDLAELIFKENLPFDAKEEVKKMYNQIRYFEIYSKKGYIDEISIRKDSYLGKYLIENSDQKNIINGDLYIYYEDVEKAYRKARYYNNDIAQKIKPLHDKKINGPKKDLLKEYDEAVLYYIQNCDDIIEYDDLFEYKMNEPIELKSECVVYENDKYSIETFTRYINCKSKVLEKRKF